MSMLTIKHVEKNGREYLQQAHEISFHPGGTNEETRVEAFGCTGIGGAVDADGHCKYADGIVYVMNDAGATVAKYVLD